MEQVLSYTAELKQETKTILTAEKQPEFQNQAKQMEESKQLESGLTQV